MAIGTPTQIGTNQASGTSLVITTTANIVTGDMVIVWCGGGSNNTAPTSVSDSSGNTYSLVAAGGATAEIIGVVFCVNAIALNSGGTITVNFGGASANHAVSAFKVSGMNTTLAEVRDTNAVPTTTSGTATSAGSQTTGALACSTSLLTGAIFTSSSDPGTFTPGGSWTAIGGTSTRFIKPAYQIVAVGTPAVWAPTWVNSVLYRSTVQIFKGAVASNTARPMGLTMGVGC